VDRRRFITLGAAALLAACAGTREPESPTAASSSTPEQGSSPTSGPDTGPDTGPTSADRPTPGPTAEVYDPASMPDVDLPTGIDPHRIMIPAIGVSAPVIDLLLTAAEVEVPEDFDDAGWWTATRRPGEIGPSVIGGHVDSRSGPAVFFRLDQLQEGDEVVVESEDGEQVVFVVDDGIQIDKYDRPPEVFGFGQGRPELRLITCGGEFDPTVGHYTDNYVIFAHQKDWDA